MNKRCRLPSAERHVPGAGFCVLGAVCFAESSWRNSIVGYLALSELLLNAKCLHIVRILRICGNLPTGKKHDIVWLLRIGAVQYPAGYYIARGGCVWTK